MYVKVEPTGCSERKGMVQIRFAMYLDKGDYGYDRHHVEVPVVPAEGLLAAYTGKKNESGIPLNNDDLNKWIQGLPKEWVDNPFHNHFIQVAPQVTDAEIMDIGEAFLQEAYVKWASEAKLDLTNDALPFKQEVHESAAIENRLQSIKIVTMERKL